VRSRYRAYFNGSGDRGEGSSEILQTGLDKVIVPSGRLHRAHSHAACHNRPRLVAIPRIPRMAFKRRSRRVDRNQCTKHFEKRTT